MIWRTVWSWGRIDHQWRGWWRREGSRLLSSRKHLERLVVTANRVATVLRSSPDVMPACGVAGARRALRSYRPVCVDLPRPNLFRSSCLCLKDLFRLQKEGLQVENPCTRMQIKHLLTGSYEEWPVRWLEGSESLSMSFTQLTVEGSSLTRVYFVRRQ